MVEDYENHRNESIKRGYEFEIEDVATSHEYIAAPIAGEDGVIPMCNRRLPHRIPIFVLKPKHLQWYEIDDEEDLEFAEKNIKLL